MEFLWEMQQPKGCKVRLDIHELHVSAHIKATEIQMWFSVPNPPKVLHKKWPNFDQQVKFIAMDIMYWSMMSNVWLMYDDWRLGT